MRLAKMPGEKTGDSLGLLTKKTVADTKRFHASFPQYAPTPLCDLRRLAEAVGVHRMFVKDESFRFGLNAFKVLGSSYAMGRYLARRAGLFANETTYEKLTSKAFREACGDITFITATDGNHGRGVAWTAHELGQRSVVYMPKGSQISNTMMLSAWRASRRKKTVGCSCKIPHGLDMKKFPAGSSRAMGRWQKKSWKNCRNLQRMFSCKLALARWRQALPPC